MARSCIAVNSSGLVTSYPKGIEVSLAGRGISEGHCFTMMMKKIVRPPTAPKKGCGTKNLQNGGIELAAGHRRKCGVCIYLFLYHYK